MKFQPGQIFRNTQRHVDVDRFSTDRPVFQYVREETPIVEETLPEEEIIEPEKVEENAEVRRVMIERYGSVRYLVDSNARLLHDDTWHGLPRALFEAGGMKWLYGSDNSTGRKYAMPVPEEVSTCKEAHESICGFNEELIEHQS
jgi:hypothetical protein